MAVATRELQYEQVPQLGLHVATTKALPEEVRPYGLGRPYSFDNSMVDITWYDAKLWVQGQRLVLLTSKQWSVARAFFEANNPKVEIGMRTGPEEHTDSLIAHPNKDGNYASNLNNTRLPKRGKGKYALLVEGSTVEKTGDKTYVIDGGEVIELPDFPKLSGVLGRDIPELGLVSGAYLESDSDFSCEEGLRPVHRGGGWGDYKFLGGLKCFNADARMWPSYFGSVVGFRPVRRG